MNLTKKQIGNLSIAALAVISVLLFFFVPPIEQNVSYHQFSDTDIFFNIPNTLNVLSNVFFLIFGWMGLVQVCKNDKLYIVSENRYAYITLFLGVTFVSFGSGYYHLNPTNLTLVWDRLPMTVGFMGLVSIIISEFISVRLGKTLLLPLLLLGGLSVFYWYITEMQGRGDLRPYALVQFLPVVAIPIILLTHRSRFENINHYWWLILSYVLAKIFEHYDQVIHEYILIISGHSLKHISAAIGIYAVIKGYQVNKTNNSM